MFGYGDAMSLAAEHHDVPVEAGRHLSVVRTEADDLISRLGELAGHIHAAQAEMTLLLGRLDACDGWHGVGLRSIGHWASIALGVDATVANAQARAGRRLTTLPALANAAQAGELGWDKVRLLDRVAEPASENEWLSLAREMSVGQLRRVVSAYRRASDDEPSDDHPGGESPTDRARRRRGIWLFDEPDGLVRVTALLESDDAAVLRAALAAHLELLWRVDDDATNSPDDRNHADASATTDETGRDDDTSEGRTPAPTDDGHADDDGPTAPEAQPAAASEVDPTLTAADPLATRRVDALVSLLRTALAQPGVPDLADDSTQVMLHIDHDLLAGHTDVGRSHYAHGPSVCADTARRACCDAVVRAFVHGKNGQPLALGRTTRTPNRSQRRALRVRDGGCAFPGCQARLWLDAHHIQHWAQGGATDLENLALLCRHHHRLHHEGGYTITMVDSRPRFHRPDGTPIAPPPPPAPDPSRGLPTLRRKHADQGADIDGHTAGALSGGAPGWSPRYALDALLS